VGVKGASRGRQHDFLLREPDAANPHVRFDERDVETKRFAPPRHVSTLHLRIPPIEVPPVILLLLKFQRQHEGAGGGLGRGRRLCGDSTFSASILHLNPNRLSSIQAQLESRRRLSQATSRYEGRL
jgi:hypothetical protein